MSETQALMGSATVTEELPRGASAVAIKPPKHPSASGPISYDDLMDHHIKFGRFHLFLFFVCGLGWLGDSVEMSHVSFLLPRLKSEWALSSLAAGTLVSVGGFGQLLGACFWGQFSDKYGRRLGFMLSLSCAVFFGLASSLSTSYWQFVAARLCLSFGTGGNIPVDFCIFSEFLPSNERGRLMVLLDVFGWAGAMYIAYAAYAFLPVVGWRWYIVISSLPSFGALLLRTAIPESPRWLLLHGRRAEAIEVLQKVCKWNRVEVDESTLQRLYVRDPEQTTSGWEKIKAMFLPKFRKSTLILLSAWFLGSMGLVFPYFVPTIYEARGMSSQATARLFMVMQLGELVGCLNAFSMVERFGRRPTLVLNFSLASAMMLMLPSVDAESEVALLLFAGLMFGDAAWSTLYATTPEVYATEIRSSAFGICSALNRVGKIVGPLIIAGALEFWGDGNKWTLTLFAPPLIVAALCCTALSETKGQRMSDRIYTPDPIAYGSTEYSSSGLPAPPSPQPHKPKISHEA